MPTHSPEQLEQVRRRDRVQLTEEEWRHHREAYDGLCLACGEWTTGGVEPDASGYRCEACDEHAVSGAEEVLMLGLMEILG